MFGNDVTIKSKLALNIVNRPNHFSREAFGILSSNLVFLNVALVHQFAKSKRFVKVWIDNIVARRNKAI